jgi:hypothetical protein
MTIASELLPKAKAHARIDGNDDDAVMILMLEAALADVAHAANYTLPATAAALPADLVFAVCDQAAMLYDARCGDTERPVGLSLAASRVVARRRGVSVGALE